MTPRNTNQVSEANALRYISSTVLAPFGYTGIPTLKLRCDPFNVLNALHEYIDSVIESQRSMGMDGGADPKLVQRVTQHIAIEHGAYSALCTHLGDIHYKLTFSLPGSNLVIGKQFLIP